MSEPVVQRPIPEARPPHLPDILTRQSPWLFVFGAVALLQIWRAWVTWTGMYPIPDTREVSTLVHLLIPSSITPLFGAALVVRHPNARKTMPLLFFGLALFALGELLSAVEEPILDMFGGRFPTIDMVEAPAATALRVFSSLLTVFALVYAAAGLSAARRKPQVAAQRPLLIWLLALAVVGVVISLAQVALLVRAEADVTPNYILLVAIGTVLSLLVTLSWAYLVSVTIGGWMAGEAPRHAWSIAALAVTLLFVIRLLFSALVTVSFGDTSFLVSTVVGYISIGAWILLLVAFWLGLPSPPGDEPADAAMEDATRADPPAATTPGSAAG